MKRKNGYFLLMILFSCMFITACGKKTESGNVPMEMENDSVIRWKSDLTGDKIDEEIVVELFAEQKTEYDAAKVKIYSGSTGDEIWDETVYESHSSQDGIYLLGEQGALLQWHPYMAQGDAVYRYRVFKLSDEGEEQEMETGEYVFSLNPETQYPYSRKELTEFAAKVNPYLEKAMMVVDTNDFNLKYSTVKNEVFRIYDVDTDIKEIEETLQRMKEN